MQIKFSQNFHKVKYFHKEGCTVDQQIIFLGLKFVTSLKAFDCPEHLLFGISMLYISRRYDVHLRPNSSFKSFSVALWFTFPTNNFVFWMLWFRLFCCFVVTFSHVKDSSSKNLSSVWCCCCCCCFRLCDFRLVIHK